MKKLINYSIAIILIATIGIVSCKKGIKEIDNPTTKHTRDKEDDAVIPFYGPYVPPMVLGSQLQNPYTISNMNLAVTTLSSNGINSPISVNVRPTHEYIKFEPTTTDELLDLMKDESLTFFSYPLDYEIEREGNWYRDPEIQNENQPTYRYASIKIGHDYNHNVRHTIISQLYIPEEDETLVGTTLRDNQEYLDKLLEQAYLQTGNEQEKKRWSWYTPSGNITIFDSRLSTNIPLEGAKITASRWFTTHNAITDANGNFTMNGQFKRPCDYKLWFARGGFTIGDNWLEPSNVIRNDIHGSWNYNVGLGYENMQGHMFRGAFRYFFQDIKGLKRPDRPNGNRTMIVAKNSNKNFGAGINYVGTPILKIARYDDSNTEYESDDFYSATVHELAHGRHVITMNAGVLQYSQVSRQIQESWPTAVEWLITGLEYQNRGVANYGEWSFNPASPPVFPNVQAGQYWHFISGNTDNNRYTSLFINLVDNFNELGHNFGTFGNPITGLVDDQVAGYTLADIEDNVLKHSYGLSTLSQYLKSNKPTGVTDAQIDLLISQY